MYASESSSVLDGLSDLTVPPDLRISGVKLDKRFDLLLHHASIKGDMHGTSCRSLQECAMKISSPRMRLYML